MEIDLKETMEMEDQETGYGELHLHLDGAITPRIVCRGRLPELK